MADDHPGKSTLTPEMLLARLDGMGFRTATHRHDAVFTVAQSASIKSSLPGAHTKNLFLKDRKGALFLVVAKDDTRIDLKRLHEAIGASGRLSFGSAELLAETLGVQPGSVTPFGAVNDAGQRVAVVLDERLMQHETLNVHPLVNTMTTAIAAQDLVSFLRSIGHPPATMSLPAPPDDCADAPRAPSG